MFMPYNKSEMIGYMSDHYDVDLTWVLVNQVITFFSLEFCLHVCNNDVGSLARNIN